MKIRYLGFAFGDSMVAKLNKATLKRSTITPEEVDAYLAKGVTSLVNPSHQSTVAALKQRYNLDIPVPPDAIKAELNYGDTIVVVSHDLQRLKDRHEYTAEEINSANFTFALYKVQK